MIKIVNIKNKPTPEYDLYIGRENKWLGLTGSKWGNPFILKKEKDRFDILKQYWDYILANKELVNSLCELKDKTLGCYCYPKLCHGNCLKTLYEEIVEKNTNIENLVFPF